jgi:hypothetical protein
MKPDASIKLVSELLDLPLVDKDGRTCGIVDDVEFDGAPGGPLALKALLVGPGAYSGRLPRWAFALVSLVAGDRIARVPLDKVETIDTAVHLTCPAEEVGLHQTENRVRALIPHGGAL